jgi:S-DNA-T family DNA segregation ATPase FtsK/SpoIIIE
MPRKGASPRQQKTSKSSGGGSFVSRQRKLEILGLVLMALGFLLFLAVVSYDADDNGLARSFSLRQALNPGENRAHNALGLFGAYISREFVANFLGYFAVVLPVLIFAWGYALFRDRRPQQLPLLSILMILAAFVTASLAGWFTLVADLPLVNWSGAWGEGTSGWMEQVFGSTGTFLILLVSLAVIALLLVDRDVQKSADRLEEWIIGARERLKESVASFRGARVSRKAERAEQREAKVTRDSGGSSGSFVSPAGPTVLERLQKSEDGPSDGLGRARIHQPRGRDPERVLPSGPVSDDVGQPSLPEAHLHTSGPELKVLDRVEEARTDSVHRPVDRPALEAHFVMPDLELLDQQDADGPKVDYGELEENKQILLDKLATYNIEITDINAIVGPTVTLYELAPAPGVKISRITALEDDLAMAMAARGIRMIAPIPGKRAIGVEIPNRHRELVRVHDMIATERFSDAAMELPLAIGKSIEGEVFIRDLTKMPHLLIAGATGSGKSVGLNACIAGLLYACHPSNLKFVMIDPKKIELQQYSRIADHYVAMPDDAADPIITDVAQALSTLRSCEVEMEERYDLLSSAQVRSVKEYNRRLKDGRLDPDSGHRHLPYIVVVVDELADLMMTAGKDIEGPIARLAQMARAVGIHLILATQRPSVDVITGLIKANFPARIAYQVASKIDSRTILDQNGAQGLVGNGDLLYMLGSQIVRLQGPFVSIEEVDRLTEFIGRQRGAGPYRLPAVDDEADVLDTPGFSSGDRDELFEEAARIIVRSQQGSVSLLQRKLSVGYSRAARIVDQLEDAGIVGPFEGSKARQVLLNDEMELDSLLNSTSS